MPKVITYGGDTKIGAYKFADRKKVCLCIEKGNEITIYGTFNSEYSANNFIDELGKFIGAEFDHPTEKGGATDTNVGTNGWIPCSDRLPEECVPVNVTWINRNPESYYAKIKDVPFSATAVYYNSKWYWYSSTCVDYLSEYGKNDFDLVDKDIDIVAWMELPSAYRPKEK